MGLRDELIQVAACAIGWAEQIEPRPGRMIPVAELTDAICHAIGKYGDEWIGGPAVRPIERLRVLVEEVCEVAEQVKGEIVIADLTDAEFDLYIALIDDLVGDIMPMIHHSKTSR
ncbi:hypothetical protein HQ535_15650 [bacterium]|nr:hypothetical protein [bacterium]